jgi:hypothetical protein
MRKPFSITSKCLAWDKKCQHLWLDQKEKKGLFSVGGFETETSNFALNGCWRVSKNQKFHARSKKKIQIDSQHTVNTFFFTKNIFLTTFLQISGEISLDPGVSL